MKLTLTGKKYGVDVGQRDMDKIKAFDDHFYSTRNESHNGLQERLEQVPGVTFVDYEYDDTVISIDLDLDRACAGGGGEAHEIILGIVSNAIARGAVLLTAYAEVGT